MVRPDSLRAQLSEVGEIQMQADGYALWLLWRGSVNPVVMQTLEDYGGIKLAEGENQALYFFFSPEVLIAAARLGVWVRFNPLALGLEIFPARMQVGRGGGKNLVFDESLWQQQLSQPSEYRVWVHASLQETVERCPGLSLAQTVKEDGLDPALWFTLEADARLPYQSSLAWYAILKPVGNTHDKQFTHGWRDFFSQLEMLLQRNKFRFSLHEHTLIFPLDGLRQVKSWCRDYLQLVERLKADAPNLYWPCVMAVVDRNGLGLSADLPAKVNVEWGYLIPDYPHMSMRNATILGDDFVAHEVRFAPLRQRPDDWASVSLRTGEQGGDSMPQFAPVNLIFGSHDICFYCGQRSHATRNCPSRFIDQQKSTAWQQVSKLSLNQMGEAVSNLDKRFAAFEDEDAKSAAVGEALRESGPEAQMLHAYYDLLWPAQFRAARFFWRARDKDPQKAVKNLASMDESPLWETLDTFAGKDEEAIGVELKTLKLRHGGDFRYYSLCGFAAVEKGNLDQAEKFWKEAEGFSPHLIVQSWHVFLQARCREIRGDLSGATLLYEQVSRACPAWYDAEYRRITCCIKSGFSESALRNLASLIDRKGHFFNRALIDPELERGAIQTLAMLHKLWVVMEERAKEEVFNLGRMRDELGTWFMPDNEFAISAVERIEKVLALAPIRNFVAFQLLMSGRMRIERDLQEHVKQQAKIYKARFRSFSARLKIIHEESAWFPFPGVLVDFNRVFNEVVASVNWAMAANFHSSDSFKKAQSLVEQEEKRLKKLENRLKLLRVVRDSTLFVLSMFETFFWFELVGCIFIFAALPLMLYYGDKLGFEFAMEPFKNQRWQVQKALLVLVSIVALLIASLRTILRFETIREKILAKAAQKPKKRK